MRGLHRLVLLAILVAAGCATTPSDSPDSAAAELDALRHSGTTETIYARGNDFFDSGELVTAFEYYQAALERDPRHLGALINSGVCARRMGDIVGAIAWYDRALEVAPEDATALQNRIVAGLLVGDARESLPLAARLAAVSPDDPHAWQQLAGLYMQLGDHRNAIPPLRRSIELDRRNPTNHFHLGLALTVVESLDEAIGSFERAIRLNPDLREAYAPYVHALTLLGDYDRAWEGVVEGQKRGARFDPELISELQRLSGQVGPR